MSNPISTPPTTPSPRPRVLIVEDEAVMADILADNLRDEGYAVEVASDGRAGLAAWRAAPPDLVVLDVMLPQLSGYDLCATQRAAGDTTPVLFVSARAQPEDRVAGLRAGGDDYLPKPFHLPEFLLRVQNMLRRQTWGERARPTEAVFRFAGYTVDYRRWVVTLRDGREEPLGERELGIFKLLAARAGEVVSRDDILDAVWGEDTFPSSRTVDNFVMRLRRLLEPDPGQPVYFHTVWGVGYKFTPEGQPLQSEV